MQQLIDGVSRFQRDVFESQRSLFERLSEAQYPKVMFIACSDSRIDPNLITQTQPGDLFVLRNAGNIIPTFQSQPDGAEAAAIEYAVNVLKVDHIIVCGHSNCGAMKGAMAPETLAELPAVAGWLKHVEDLHRRAKKRAGACQDEVNLQEMVEENIRLQIENIQTHPCVASALGDGRLRLHGWCFEIAAGSIRVLDAMSSLFLPLSEEAAGSSVAPARTRKEGCV